jgi:hypothetical protein
MHLYRLCTCCRRVPTVSYQVCLFFDEENIKGMGGLVVKALEL